MFQAALHELAELLAVRRPQHTQQVCPGLRVDSLSVAELIKTVLTVVAAHSRRADAPKGQIFLRDVKQDVVYCRATGHGFRENAVLLGRVPTVNLQRPIFDE